MAVKSAIAPLMAGSMLGTLNFRLGPGYFPNCNITTLYASYCHTQQHVAFVSCELTDSVTAEGVQKDFRLEGCHLYKSCDISGADVDVLMLMGSRFDGDLKVTEMSTRRASWPLVSRFRLLAP